MALCLPRDELTIPVARHICRHALEDLGVDESSRSDIEIALSEACANVLRHSGGDDQYEVRFSVDQEVCVIRVVDTGRGFDASSLTSASPSDESGRGIQLIKALVDSVRFESKPEEGTVVHLEKRLDFTPDSALKRLTAD